MSDVFQDDDPTEVEARGVPVTADELADLFGDFNPSIDTTKLSPPDEAFPAILKTIEFVKENKKGEKSAMLIISLNLDLADWPAYEMYDKAFYRDYLWLGVDKVEVMGARRAINFLEAATGEKIEGEIDWLKYGLQRVGDKIMLVGLEGLPIGVQLETKEDRENPEVKRQGIKTYRPAEGLKPLDASEFSMDDDI